MQWKNPIAFEKNLLWDLQIYSVGDITDALF